MRGVFRGVVAPGLLVALAGSSARTALAQESLALVYEDGAGNSLPYRLFLPPGYDEPGAEFPLVLHLHGAGERGTNNSSQLFYINGLIEETRTDHPAFLLVPQAAPGTSWSTSGAPTQMTLSVIDQLEQQYGIDTDRRYVTGLSMGGFGAWSLAADYPGFFEAVAPLSAYGQPSRAEDYLASRLWAFHGRRDTTVPAGPDRETIEAIRAAGGDPLYLEIDDGHGIWTPIYDDPSGEFYDWMFDGVAPKIPDWEYDPATGTVRIDASQAPGGQIGVFGFSVNQLNVLTLPDQVLVDGVAVPSSEFFLGSNRIGFDYNAQGGAGLTGVVEIPGLMPAGLDFLSLSELTGRMFYFSDETGTSRRWFNVTVATIPEPTAAGLAMAAAGAALAGRRRVGRSIA